MLPIQFELDDFAEAVDAIRRPLATQQAELEAVKQRIAELVQALAEMAQVEKALNDMVIALDKAEDECECDWFCWLVSTLPASFVEAMVLAIARNHFAGRRRLRSRRPSGTASSGTAGMAPCLNTDDVHLRDRRDDRSQHEGKPRRRAGVIADARPN